MTREPFTRALIVVLAIVAILCVAQAFMGEAKAQDQQCVPPDEAQQIMTDNGYEPLGVFPFAGGTAVFYRFEELVYAAPIDSSGCVGPYGYGVPDFAPALPPAKGTPA